MLEIDATQLTESKRLQTHLPDVGKAAFLGRKTEYQLFYMKIIQNGPEWQRFVAQWQSACLVTKRSWVQVQLIYNCDITDETGTTNPRLQPPARERLSEELDDSFFISVDY